jgi:polysaccharide biosynthesis transport protein
MKTETLPTNERDEENGIKWLKNTIRRNKRILLIIPAAIAGLMFFKLVITPKEYLATSSVLVEPHTNRLLKEDNLTPDALTSDIVVTATELMKNNVVLMRVITENHLQPDPKKDPFKLFGLISTPYTDDEILKKVRKKVKISPRKISRVVDISFTAKDPELAAKVANSYAEEFLKYGIEEKVEIAKKGYDLLQEEIGKLKKKSEDSQNALQKYCQENKAVSLEDGQNITVERLKSINATATASIENRIKIENDKEQIDKILSENLPKEEKSKRLYNMESLSRLPEVQSLQLQINAAETELASMAGHYLEKNPKHIAVVNKIDALKSALYDALLSGAEKTREDYARAKAQEEKTNESLSKQTDQTMDLNSLYAKYRILKDQATSDSAIYKSVFERINETDIAQQVATIPYRFVDRAIAPSKAESPKVIKGTIIAYIGSLFLVGIFVIIKAATSDKINSIEEAEYHLGKSVLTIVPKGGNKNGILDEALQESFRSLRTHLKDTRTILFTSCAPSEGKSFCSLNYAKSLAISGDKTLLIEGDMRMGDLSKKLLDSVPRYGLKNFLQGDKNLNEVSHKTGIENLFILPIGDSTASVDSLLKEEKLKKLDEAIKSSDFKYIVIDTPPINAVSDALELLQICRSTVLVVKCNKVSSSIIKRSLRTLENAGAAIEGVVLNEVPPFELEDSGHYYSYKQGEV